MYSLQISAILILSMLTGATAGRASIWNYWEKFLQNNTEIRSLELGKAAAEETLDLNRSALYPRVSAQIRAYDQKTGYSGLSASEPGAMSSIRLEQTLFSPSFWHRLDSAETAKDLEELRLQGLLGDMRLAVLAAYWHAVVLAESQVTYHSVFYQLTDRLEKQGEEALAGELRTREDALHWKIAVSAIRVQGKQVETDLSLMTEKLKSWAQLSDLKLCLRKPDFVPQKSWIDRWQALPHYDDRDVKAAVLNERKLRSELREAQSEFWPRLSFFAEWESFSGQSQVRQVDTLGTFDIIKSSANRVSRIGLSLDWILFEGWKSRHATRFASKKLKLAEVELAQARQNQNLMETDGREKLVLAWKRFDEALVLKEFAEKNLYIVLKEHKNGLKSFDAYLAPLSQFHETHQLYYRSLIEFFPLLWTHWATAGQLDDKAIQTLFNFCSEL